MKKLCRANLVYYTLLALLWCSLGQDSTRVLAQQPTPQPTPVEVKIDPKIFDAYVGQYEDAVKLGFRRSYLQKKLIFR